MAKTTYKIGLRRGDSVMVRSGKYKGYTGKIIAVHPTFNKVTVEGVNVAKRHKKPTKSEPQGGVVEITRPIWVSKVGLLDLASKKPSRAGYKFSKGGSKIRILKTTGKEVKS